MAHCGGCGNVKPRNEQAGREEIPETRTNYDEAAGKYGLQLATPRGMTVDEYSSENSDAHGNKQTSEQLPIFLRHNSRRTKD
jgi:hypothetical protein